MSNAIRKAKREVAKNKMKKGGIVWINKKGGKQNKSFFANHWKDSSKKGGVI